MNTDRKLYNTDNTLLLKIYTSNGKKSKFKTQDHKASRGSIAHGKLGLLSSINNQKMYHRLAYLPVW